jgi:hypothetical protein
MDYNPMLAIHGLNPRPALACDLFFVYDTRVLSIFHLRLHMGKWPNLFEMAWIYRRFTTGQSPYFKYFKIYAWSD